MSGAAVWDNIKYDSLVPRIVAMLNTTQVIYAKVETLKNNVCCKKSVKPPFKCSKKKIATKNCDNCGDNNCGQSLGDEGCAVGSCPDGAILLDTTVDKYDCVFEGDCAKGMKNHFGCSSVAITKCGTPNRTATLRIGDKVNGQIISWRPNGGIGARIKVRYQYEGNSLRDLMHWVQDVREGVNMRCIPQGFEKPMKDRLAEQSILYHHIRILYAQIYSKNFDVDFLSTIENFVEYLAYNIDHEVPDDLKEILKNVIDLPTIKYDSNVDQFRIKVPMSYNLKKEIQQDPEIGCEKLLSDLCKDKDTKLYEKGIVNTRQKTKLKLVGSPQVTIWNVKTKRSNDVWGISQDWLSVDSYVLNYIYEFEVIGWSPVLLLYFLQTNPAWEPGQNCPREMIPIPGGCTYIDPKMPRCDYSLTLPTQFNTFFDADKLLRLQSSEECVCYHSRFMPSKKTIEGWSDQDMRKARQTIMCFSKDCNDNNRNRENLNDTTCQEFCDEAKRWVEFNLSTNAAKIDNARFKRICGKEIAAFTTPDWNWKVGLVGGIIAALPLILFWKKKASVLISMIYCIMSAGLVVFLTAFLAGKPKIKAEKSPCTPVCKSRNLIPVFNKEKNEWELEGAITIPNIFCPYMYPCDCMSNEDCQAGERCASTRCAPR
jgi:hypothetical protein